MSLDVSVVVPTHGRPVLLARCLLALREQSLDRWRYEIIVVSDGRDEETQALLAAITSQTAAVVRYFSLPRARGPAAARNAGWHAARAPVVAFTDDDTIPARDWLAKGLRAMTADVEAVWGRVVVPLPSDPTDYEFDTGHLAHAGFVTANCFCRRSALERVGGFDERFRLAWREDSDLFFSLLAGNGTVQPAPAAIVVHPVRQAPWGISVLQQRKAEFNALLYKKHPRLYRKHIQATPPWHYYAIVAALALALIGALTSSVLASFGIAGWLVLTGEFCRRRLAATSRAAPHVAEMIVTSALIPPLAVFWRLHGAVKFRVFFL